jgi:hypothetical protein
MELEPAFDAVSRLRLCFAECLPDIAKGFGCRNVFPGSCEPMQGRKQDRGAQWA